MHHRSIITRTGHGPATAVAVLMVGLVAVGIVFLVLGGLLYLGEQPPDQRALSSVPARSALAADPRAVD
ncbi:hypothetical protein C1D09_029495 [Mesorhizobium intechi]|nr:hypothetical protein C1D09_029495 [Mesorhizobium intechi]